MTATALAPRSDPGFLPDPTAPAPRVELERAAALLLHGARCLSDLANEGVLSHRWPSGDAAGVRARYVANCLRELDTFLKGVLDVVAPTPPGQPRRHNAANRVDRLLRATAPAPTLTAMRMPGVTTDVDRLRALGRSRACLWHCHGLVRRADRPEVAWMTAGWCAPASTRLRRYGVGERMTPGGPELAGVAAFYHDLAGRIARR
ncbi:hypothetical protein [Sphingomonas sp. Mn802worker]|uniref:hypothetical protein n=1 Tax=Sphingomonas sp. Mn802worker TaxID=629773 RepID=UPI00035FAADD|nr:hypothetical protein [Sphingomonas sp. Mn802worker]